MTIEKALDMLGMIEFNDTEAHLHTWYKGIDDDMNEAVRMVIETLEAEFSTDCISRQATLNALYDLCDTGETLKENPWRDNPHIDAITDAIDNLPPVNPQSKTGHWIADVDRWGDIVTTVNGYRCSECNTFNTDKDNYCPNCGADMRGEQNE